MFGYFSKDNDERMREMTEEDKDPAIDPGAERLSGYGSLMFKCFLKAGGIVVQVHDGLETPQGVKLVSLAGFYGMLPDIALALFNRCTRETPERVDLAKLPLDYLATFKREEEQRMAAFTPAPQVPPCKHPELAALWGVLLSSDGNSFSLFGRSVIAALSVDTYSDNGGEGYLRCPSCSDFVSVEKFKDGTIFAESD